MADHDTLAEVNPMPSGEGPIPGFISGRLMAAYRLDDHVLHVERAATHPDGRVDWHYVLEHEGDVIFEGADFSTPWNVSFGEAAHGVLGFLTLKEGDTDEEYFSSYTPDQIDWRDEHAETLGLYALDPED